MERPANLDGWPNPDFLKNQSAYPSEELWKHIGKHVAWNWEGTEIIADADTLDELADKVEAMQINFSRVVFDYVDDPNVGFLGAGAGI